MGSKTTATERVRLFHPEHLYGELIAVMVRAFQSHPKDRTKQGLVIDWYVDPVRLAFGEFVKHGGLINQLGPWRREGLVVGVMGQSGAGLQTPWALHPVPEVRRPDVVQLLAADPVAGWLSEGPAAAPSRS